MWSPRENDDFFGEPQEKDKDPPHVATGHEQRAKEDLAHMLRCLRLIHAAYDADGADLSAWPGRAADEIERLREHAVVLANTEREVERERCAAIARSGCLVPPDGGQPTEDERLLCEEIERRIQTTLHAKNTATAHELHAAQEADELRASLKAVVSHWREFGPDHGFDECIERAAGRRGLDA